MQDEIKLLKEKVDYLNDGSRKLHDLYDKSREKSRNLQKKLESCESGNQDEMILRKELDLCRDELLDEKNLNDQQYRNLRLAERNIKSLEGENDELQNQLTAEKAKIQNLQNRIQQLESDLSRMQSQSSQNQREMRKKVQVLTTDKQNLQDEVRELEDEKKKTLSELSQNLTVISK